MKCKIFSFGTMLLMVFGVAACGSQKASGHHYTDKFLYDENKHWRECTDSGCLQQVDVAIHEFLDWTVVEDATCSKTGRATSKCSVCDYVLEKIIPIKDHDVNDGWSTDDGYHWHTCKNDPEEKVDYNAHSFDWKYTKEPTCVLEGKGYQQCTVCGYKLPEETIPALNHNWVLDENKTTYATCDKDGVVVHVCTLCKAEESKTVKAGHGWGQPTYEWSEDYSRVTATRVCENNSEHVQTETVLTDYEHVAPTCDQEGTNTYVSKAFKNSAFKQQTKVFALSKCSETLEHHCEAVKYTAGEIYDECTICHKKYNIKECAQPWVDYYFPTELEQSEESDNGAGAYASFNKDTKVATLPKHAGKSAYLTYKSTEPIAESIGKNYFVITYTLMKDSGGWWDTYINVNGMGTNCRTRFGRINAEAVQSFDMKKATFIKDGEVVGWNAVGVGETGTLILDISGLINGVTSFNIYSDGGVQLRIDYVGFRSSHCEHDFSCYKENVGYTCAGLIKTSFQECEECHHRINEETSGLPFGYSSIDLGNPLGVRWSSDAYDFTNHIITVPNTYLPGPMFTNPSAKKMIAEMTLDWDDQVTDASQANFQFYFMNHELADQFPTDNMYNHFYDIKCFTGGLQGANDGIVNPAAVSDVARLLNDSTGAPQTTFKKGEKIVLEITIENPSIKDFARFLICGTNGTVVTIHNVIYC